MYFPLILGEKSSFLRKMHFFLKFFAKKFGSNEKLPTFAIPNETNTVSKHAEVAQLVEHNLAKVGVASSSLVFRSKNKKSAEMLTFVLKISPDGVQSYVSRPCAQGTAFLLYNRSPNIQAKEKGLEFSNPCHHYCILQISIHNQGDHIRPVPVGYRKIERHR